MFKVVPGQTEREESVVFCICLFTNDYSFSDVSDTFVWPGSAFRTSWLGLWLCASASRLLMGHGVGGGLRARVRCAPADLSQY